MKRKKTLKGDKSAAQAVIMFTDIVGYSRMMNEDSVATLDFLRKHDAMLNKIIRSHAGRVIKTIGDSFMAEFKSCDKALLAAVSMQKQMEKEFFGKKNIRIGLHAGQAVRKGKDLFGHDVNIASRLESQAPHGGICVSEAFFKNTAFPKNIKYEKIGLLYLKNIPEPVAAYWIYPTEGVFLKVVEKRAKEKFNRVFMRALIALSLVAFIVAGTYLKPYIKDLIEKQRWTPWITERFNSAADFDNNWVRSYNYEINEKKGEMQLVNDFAIHPRKELPKQPFTANVDFRLSNENLSAYYVFIIATDMREVYPYYDKSGRRIYSEWDGMYGYIELQPKFAVLGAGAGNQSLNSEYAVSKIEPLKGRESVHNLSIVYDRDILTFRLDRGKPVRIVIKKLNKGKDNTFKFAFYGRNILVKKTEIFTRKLYKDLDLLTAADNYRLEGKIRQSLDSYDELIRRAINPEDRSMYLYKKACAFADSGEKEGAAETLKKIMTEKTNDYTYYAAYDLAEIMAQKSITGDKELVKLLDIALLAPEDNPAKFSAQTLQLKRLLKSGNAERAEELAKKIIFQADSPNSADAFDTLFNSIYKNNDAASRLRAYDTLDRIIANRSKGSGGLYNLAITKKLEMLYDAKMPSEFFKTATEPFLNYDYLLRSFRRKFFEMLMNVSAAEGFTKARENWTAALEKQAGKASTAYKNLMRECGFMSFQESGMWKEKNPLVYTAYRFLVGRLKYSTGKRQTDGIFFSPDCLSVFSYGLNPQEKAFIQNNKEAVYNYDSGLDWGCGLNVSPNSGGKIVTGGVNMDGNKYAELEILMPKGVVWVVRFAETGSKHYESRDSFRGVNGADGENYTVGEYVGTGKWEKVIIPLIDLGPHLYWGNQDGNNVLDLQSLNAIDIVINGKQGKGTLKLKSIRFIP